MKKPTIEARSTPRNPAFSWRYVTEWRAGDIILAVTMSSASPVEQYLRKHFEETSEIVDTVESKNAHGEWVITKLKPNVGEEIFA